MIRRTLFGLLLLATGAAVGQAQERGWSVGLEYQSDLGPKDIFYVSDLPPGSEKPVGELILPSLHTVRLSGGYCIPVLFKGFFVNPDLSFYYSHGKGTFFGTNYVFNTIGFGVGVEAGYRVFRFLEVTTGPSLDAKLRTRYTKNDHLTSYTYPNEALWFWKFGIGVPIGKFTVVANYSQHLIDSETQLRRNRWSVGVKYRF